jgi:hypothetical protein
MSYWEDMEDLAAYLGTNFDEENTDDLIAELG